jgi:bacterioferritin-associated ferredoxin
MKDVPQTSAPSQADMPSRRLPSWLVQEYLAILFCNEELDPDVRQRRAMESHAELNFRVTGGGKCGICNSHVRHVVQVTVQTDEQARIYRCLCTRCLEGERSTADMIALTLGRATVMYQRRPRQLPLRRWDEPRQENQMTFAAHQ